MTTLGIADKITYRYDFLTKTSQYGKKHGNYTYYVIYLLYPD